MFEPVVPPGGFSESWSTADCLNATQLYWRAVELGYRANVAWSLAIMTTEKLFRSSHIVYSATWEKWVSRFMGAAGLNRVSS
jgi:hypothetical protein